MSQNCRLGMASSPGDLFKQNGFEFNYLTTTQDIFSTQIEELTSDQSMVASNYTQVSSYFSPPKNRSIKSQFFQISQPFEDSKMSQLLSQNFNLQNEELFQSQVEHEINFLDQISQNIHDDSLESEKPYSQHYLRSQHHKSFLIPESFNDNKSQNFELTQPPGPPIDKMKTPSLKNGNNFQSQKDLFESCKSLQSTDPSTVISVNELIELGDLPIPQSIINMYMIIREKYSDWVFVYAMTSQLCSDFFPTGTYFNLKQSLLLSIASINGSSTPPIQIIALGRNTSDANIIMNSIGKLADR